MKILFVSKEGDGLGVAHRLVTEGHDVFYYIKEPRFHLAGKGIVDRVLNFRPYITRCDLVVCDMVGMGRFVDLFRRLGKPVFSCSSEIDKLELDRQAGMNVFKEAGIDIPETHPAGSPAEAKTLISGQAWGKGWVLKPDGNKATSKTMVVRDPETIDWALHNLGGGSLIIQRVVDGIEVSTEGWFNGRDFIKPFNHTFEEKRFLEGDLGANTGCMGNIVIAAKSNRLTRATVERLGAYLAKSGYRGPVDVNAIVSKDRADALEITGRMGYDAIEALLEGLREPSVDLIFDTAIGVKKEMAITNDYMIAVRLSIPPWPSAKPKEEEHGAPVLGLTPPILKHVFFTDVYKEGNEYKTAGGDGVLMKVTARGRDVNEARNRVYRTLKDIDVNSKQYRLDIGERVPKAMNQLKEWGWI